MGWRSWFGLKEPVRFMYESDEKVRGALTLLSQLGSNNVHWNDVDVMATAKAALFEEPRYARAGLERIAAAVSPGDLFINGVDIGLLAERGLQ